MSDETAPAKPVGRPTKYDPVYADQVVDAMREGLSLTAFAGLIGVARSTINEWMTAHPEFSEAVSRGKACRLLHWERAALNVAARGGGPGTATVIVFGLKNMGGDEWSDTVRQEHSGPGGGALRVETKPDLSGLDQAGRDALRTVLDQVAGRPGGDAPGA